MKIDDVPFPRLRELLLSLTPQDENPNLGLARIELMMTEGLYLHGLGIIADRTKARFTLADADGKEFTVNVRAVPMNEAMSMQWTYAFKQAPLSRQRPGEVFWSQYLPESRTVYCNFSRL